jgi:nitrate reductase alpha subunit
MTTVNQIPGKGIPILQILETNFHVLFIRMTTVNPLAKTGSSLKQNLVYSSLELQL